MLLAGAMDYLGRNRRLGTDRHNPLALQDLGYPHIAPVQAAHHLPSRVLSRLRNMAYRREGQRNR